MPSVQEVHDQPGVSLQPEVTIIQEMIDVESMEKKFVSVREIDMGDGKMYYANDIFRKSVIVINIYSVYL